MGIGTRNRRQAEKSDFGPNELTVETLYGETGDGLGAIEEGMETLRDESVTSD